MPKAKKKSSDTARNTSAFQSGATAESLPVKQEDAIALLTADHRKVDELFRQAKQSNSQSEKEKFAKQACLELIIHTRLEEELFYPACRDAGLQESMLNEAQVEHDGAKLLISDLQNASPADQFYDAKVVVLAEYIKHHVNEEEAPEGIFANAKQVGMDLEELGERIRQRKQQLLSESSETMPKVSAVRSFDLGTLSQQQRYGDNRQEDQMASQFNERDRDERGRFESDDRGRGRGYSGRDQDDEGRYGRQSGGYSSRDDRDEDRRGSRGGSGWYGDTEGHSRASEEGWEHRGGGSQRGYSSRSERDRDDEGNGRRSSGRGWYGDPEGHSRASEEGWENRGGGSQRGYSSRSERDRDDEGNGRRSSGRGWYGDPEGHSRASEEGWENRGGGSSRESSRGYSSRSDRGRDEEDNDRSRSESGRGWFGDPQGHARASEEGWEHRGGGSRRSSSGSNRDDDNGRSGSGRGWHGDPQGHAEAARHRNH